MTGTKVRTASGRFAAPLERSELLQWARTELPKVEQRIDVGQDWRRAILRRERADLPAAVAIDRELADLRDLKLRLVHQTDVLSVPVVVPEQSQQKQRPTDLHSARARLLEIEPWIVAWQAVPDADRSARLQSDLDGLINEQYSLTKLIMSLQPKESAA